MFPVTIEGIRYPQHFKSQAKAMAAAYEFRARLAENPKGLERELGA